LLKLVQQAQGNAGTAPDRPTITSNYVIPFLVTLGFGLIFAVLKALGSFLIVLLTTNRNKSVGARRSTKSFSTNQGEEKRATEVTTATAPVPAPVTRNPFGTRNPPLVSTEIAPPQQRQTATARQSSVKFRFIELVLGTTTTRSTLKQMRGYIMVRRVALSQRKLATEFLLLKFGCLIKMNLSIPPLQ
jgi:hypothetical protein